MWRVVVSVGRRASALGVRGTPVAVRLSVVEVEFLDGARGSMTRSEFLRWLLLQARKQQPG